MKVTAIETGKLLLDGGAMFGVVPRALWEQLNPPDERNRCTWALRCLLVETGSRKILVDTGIGDKQGAKFRSHFGLEEGGGVVGALQQQGHEPESITDVLLTHLHFDHAGGALRLDERGRPAPSFPNATYWSNETHYKWAISPNAREKASFLPENFEPLKAAGLLKFIDEQKDDVAWLEGISIRFTYGHTEAMMAPIFHHGGRALVFCADVIPSSFHLGLPYIMAYDIRPLKTLEEKERILEECLAGGHYLAFAHDPFTPGVSLQRPAGGKIGKKEELGPGILFQA